MEHQRIVPEISRHATAAARSVNSEIHASQPYQKNRRGMYTPGDGQPKKTDVAGARLIEELLRDPAFGASQASGWDFKPFLASLCEPGSVLSGTHDPQYVVVASAP
jgi:hypothetical protein